MTKNNQGDIVSKTGFAMGLLVFVFLVSGIEASGKDTIAFNAENWQFFGGKVAEHGGRECLKGSAMLKGVVFENGTMEFDVWVTGKRSYPGVRFRAVPGGNAENIYIRPHVIGFSPDALQYTPVFNNAACWQLYNGEGFTSGIQMPLNQWVRVKIAVSGSRARVYLGNSGEPVLKIDHLKHNVRKGGIVLTAPPDGSAYFSDFRMDQERTPDFGEPVEEDTHPGIITDWEISQPFKYGKIDVEKTYDRQVLKEIQWKKVKPEKSGLVNVSGHIRRVGTEPDFIFARTFVHAPEPKDLELRFGYSDWVFVFLNGKQLFAGSSPYKGRGGIFQGIIGYYDTLVLPLEKGKNELLFIVGETFGGWGFMAKDGKAEFMEPGMQKMWESERRFMTSESVLYDSRRDVLYVTNFDQFNVPDPKSEQFVSRVSLTGKILDYKWVEGLNNPLGMTLFKNRIYVAERKGIAVIDPDNAGVIKRIPIPGCLFPNDITLDKKGAIYVTDSRKNVIWRVWEGKSEEWLAGEDVRDPNVIYYHKGKILFGNSYDRSLKLVEPGTKKVSVVARFEKGFIDGLRIDKNGNYLVSLWHGKVFRVTPGGSVTKILDTTTTGKHIADFEYIQKNGMLVIPTFFGNTVSAYQLD